MSTSPTLDAEIVVLHKSDLPLQRAWERLEAQMSHIHDFMYLWSETQKGKLEYVHHFRNMVNQKYARIEA